MNKQNQPDKPITLTLTILPLKEGSGKRKIILSGAPEGEMPIALTGTFAERHALLDQLWMTLQKRKPQPVKVKDSKTRQTKPAPAKDGEPETVQLDNSGANAPETTPVPTLTPPEDLPIIETQIAMPLEDNHD